MNRRYVIVWRDGRLTSLCTWQEVLYWVRHTFDHLPYPFWAVGVIDVPSPMWHNFG